MKKLLIIILLLITANAFGQAVLSGSKGWDGMYNIRADQFFTRCVTAGVTLTDAQKRWYNDSIFVPLSDSGLIGATRAGDSIQALWCFALFPNGSANVAVLNLLSDSNTCLAVNSPTFTDSGVVGNGSSSYLNSNFNPVWDSSICKLNSVSLGVYSKGDRSNSSTISAMGSSAGSDLFNIILRRTTNTSRFRLNTTTTAVEFIINEGAIGYYIGSRQEYNLTYMLKKYEGTSYTGTSLFISNNKVNLPIYILAQNDDGSPANYETVLITFAYVGSGLSADKCSKLGNILNNSLKGRGYNVY
jgi:hypothetical protein